jgi:hypothetical protein
MPRLYSGRVRIRPDTNNGWRGDVGMRSGQPRSSTGAGQRLAGFGRVLTTDVDQAAQHGVSISEVLLDIQLDHLRRRLLAAAPGLRVIDIAFDLSYTHLGRMAKACQVKFGEKPSDTWRAG